MVRDGEDVLKNLDIKQIVGLIEALDRSNFDSLQLDVGHFRLTLGKGEPASVLPGEMAPAPAAPKISMPAPAATAQPKPAPTPKPSKPAANMAGTVEVPSPIMGLFYSRPDPSSPPFVSLGGEVDEETTVGLIEVMKVFNAVQAGTKGTVVEICVQDAQTIEIGQTLFRIRPA